MELQIDLWQFDISRIEEYVRLYTDRYLEQLNFNVIDVKPTPGKLQYKLHHPFHEEAELVISIDDVENFIPQVQVIDKAIVKHAGIVRLDGILVFEESGKLGKTSILALLAALTGSIFPILDRIGVKPKTTNWPEFGHMLNEDPLNAVEFDTDDERIKSSLKHLKNSVLVYDNEPATWLATIGTGGKRIVSGLDYVIRLVAGYVTEVHDESCQDTLVDRILYAWLDHGRTRLWHKRLRLVEHLVYGIRKRLYDVLIRGKASVSLAEHWYASGLFVYSTASNPLGMLALKTRTTLRGIGGFRELPLELRLINDDMYDLNLCPIDTGDRENAGAVHFYTDRYLVERLVDRPTFLDTFFKQIQDFSEYRKVRDFLPKNNIFKAIEGAYEKYSA